jgi:hypothetical protein
MTRVGIKLNSLLLMAFCFLGEIFAGEAPSQNPAPDFQEVYDLIRTHLSELSEAELNRTAVEALASALSPRVALVGGDNSNMELAGGPLVQTSNLFDGTITYLRITRVESGLAKAVREAYERFGTNKLTGVVLDLRYAGGGDYEAAADTADLFIAKERPLLNWGKGVVHSKDKSDAITLPVAVLVNGQTARAAEALAAVLREQSAGLILGNKTAGQAMIAEEYPLKNGQRLRIATAMIQVGESTLLSSQGVKPDITVEINPEDERAYYADAFTELARTNAFTSASVLNTTTGQTNRARRPRFNEAELVRERREGFVTDAELAAARQGEPEKPVVRDPALARALDVLKGLALVRQTRS